MRITTYGDGCAEHERTDVEATSAGAVVRPYNRRTIPGENEGCTAELKEIVHEAALSFDTAGAKTLVVHGRRVAYPVDEAFEVPWTITIE